MSVMPEEAIKFLENACRNWTRVPRLSKNDIADVCGALDAFAKHRSTSTEEVERLREALREIANTGFEGAPDISMRQIARTALGAASHVE